MRRLPIAFVTFAALIAPATAAHAGKAPAPTTSAFSRMFPTLPAFAGPTIQQFADLAQTQFDPNAADKDNPDAPSWVTYFGQFIDHDQTKDTSPPPTDFVDPTTLLNARTFRFDLDSVYGGGPSVSPQLYEADGKRFKVQNPNPNGVRDLPRNPDGSAILVEGRNDENEIISQIHVAFLMFHNARIAAGESYATARKQTIDAYQSVVLRDYLPHVLGQEVVDAALAGTLPHIYDPGPDPAAPRTPVEFSVAAFRFGHSEVRKAYELNTATKFQVFNSTAGDLHGGRQIPAGRQIDWGKFVRELAGPSTIGATNASRAIDPLISSGLFDLPIPGAEATGSNVLAFRNMTRAFFYEMPSGQSVAAAMGVPVITPEELNLGPGFESGTPLWYYILAESERVKGGKFLGPVGARIVADVLVTVLTMGDAKKKVQAPPTLGVRTFADFLVMAGVATRP
jgi:hypothetical protein